MAPREAYEKPVFSIKQRKKTHANRWRRKKRAVWRANHDLDPKPSIRKNLTSEKTSSVEAAVSAGRDEASCLLLRCRSFATPCVFLAWNYTRDSQWQMFGSVLEAPGLAGRAFSYECILSPVGRSAQMPAAFLIPDSSALPQHEKSNDIALYCATTKRHIVEASQRSCQTPNMKLVLWTVRWAISANWLRIPRSDARRLAHSLGG